MLQSKCNRAVICILILLAASCTQAPPPQPLRVGFNPWPGYEFIYLAKVKGFYEAQGVNVKLVELNSLGDVRRAFERGQIDIMGSSVVELLVAAETTGRPINAILVSDSSNGADILLAKNDVPDVAALKGKKIGMESATVDVLNVSIALNSAQLTLKDVIPVYGAQDDLVASFEAGEISALQTYAPHTAKFLADSHYKRLFDTSKVPGQIIDVLSVDATLLTTRSDDVRKFIKAYFQAVAAYKKAPEEGNAIMAARERISAAEFSAAIGELKLMTQQDQATYFGEKALGEELLTRSAESLVAAGVLKRIPNAKAFFNPTINGAALGEQLP